MDLWRSFVRAGCVTGMVAGMVARTVAGMVVACALGSGCSGGSGTWPETGVPYPFAPASVRIHPLTHLDRSETGEMVLVCHIVLLDPWGESVRGVGELKISLFGPARPVSMEDRVWVFDLNTLTTNDTLYDLATRTYRLQLIDLPGWALEMGSAAGSSSSGSIVVELTTVGVDGQAIVARGQSMLRR